MQEDFTNDNEDVTTDNLETTETTEPENDSDNSDTVENKPEDNENSEDKEALILGKFKTNEDLQNAYAENEKQLGKMSNEIGELRKVKEQFDKITKEREEIAKAYGYNSVDEMQQASLQIRADQDIANFTADEYAKHLHECEFPDEMRRLLMEYKNNPTKELLDTIEDEFSKGTLKEVAQNLAFRKGQLDYERQQALNQQEYANVESYLDEVTTKYNDDRYFGDEAFKSLYADLFKSFGTNLKTDYAIEKLEAYVQSRIAKHLKQKASTKENENATDAIGGLSDSGSEDVSSSKSLLDMDEAELLKAIRKFK